MKPKVLIFAGYGLNCDEETKYAFDASGGKADIVHINDIIDGFKKLKDYQVICLQGGFSYGDDTGSGNAYANKIRNHLWENILSFIKKDKLVIGICNGFQILVNLGLLPALKGFGTREAELLPNNTGRYTVRFVDLEVKSHSPWLSGIKTISMPIAHGEGKFFAQNDILQKLEKKNMIALKYINGKTSKWNNLCGNPNGSLNDIAGITDESGKILGLMPHPERAQFFYQLPNWTFLKEKYMREGKKIPKDGPGLKIFANAVSYFD